MFLKKIDTPLQEGLESLGLEKATKFQKACIGRIKSGFDLVAYGPANSGKTTATIIGLTQVLKHAVADVPRAMVVCANKESVLKFEEEANEIAKYTDLRYHVGFEGADIQKQKDKIYFGTDVVVGTAKRICDLMSIEGINFAEIKTLVIDQAELFMKHSGMSYLNRIAESLPNAQKIIFTQTESVNIDRFAGKFMGDVMEVEASDDDIIPVETNS